MNFIGLGVDIEAVSRFRKMDVVKYRKFYHRVFTKTEIKYCLSKSDPYPHFAARFAAKEAAMKASSAYLRLFFRDIAVGNAKNGMPVLKILGKKRTELRNKIHDFFFLLSLSHTEDNAVAVVNLISGSEGTVV